MSDWQKVRVEFDDADGNRVLAVMFQDPDSDFQLWRSHDPVDGLGLIFDSKNEVTVTSIRELPTSLGAVIEVPTVPGDCERLVLTSIGWIDEMGNEVRAGHFDVLNFTVLSEGVPFD